MAAEAEWYKFRAVVRSCESNPRSCISMSAGKVSRVPNRVAHAFNAIVRAATFDEVTLITFNHASLRFKPWGKKPSFFGGLIQTILLLLFLPGFLSSMILACRSHRQMSSYQTEKIKGWISGGWLQLSVTGARYNTTLSSFVSFRRTYRVFPGSRSREGQLLNSERPR